MTNLNQNWDWIHFDVSDSDMNDFTYYDFVDGKMEKVVKKTSLFEKKEKFEPKALWELTE